MSKKSPVWLMKAHMKTRMPGSTVKTLQPARVESPWQSDPDWMPKHLLVAATEAGTVQVFSFFATEG